MLTQAVILTAASSEYCHTYIDATQALILTAKSHSQNNVTHTQLQQAVIFIANSPLSKYCHTHTAATGCDTNCQVTTHIMSAPLHCRTSSKLPAHGSAMISRSSESLSSRSSEVTPIRGQSWKDRVDVKP